jgi:hypothetical protein
LLSRASAVYEPFRKVMMKRLYYGLQFHGVHKIEAILVNPLMTRPAFFCQFNAVAVPK